MTDDTRIHVVNLLMRTLLISSLGRSTKNLHFVLGSKVTVVQEFAALGIGTSVCDVLEDAFPYWKQRLRV